MWRIIASSTTFTVAYCVEGTIKNATTITAIDTVLKTIFYFYHEKAWNNQTLCFQDTIKEENEEDEKIETEDKDFKDTKLNSETTDLNNDTLENISENDVVENLTENNRVENFTENKKEDETQNEIAVENVV
jgi:uncharacterized membrane protein